VEDQPVNIKALNGFKDILPGEVELWQRLEAVARDIFARFNFSEIRLPILEKTDLFARAIGVHGYRGKRDVHLC